MKHNTCLKQTILSLLVTLICSSGFAKIINSEFLNQAEVGSEGPQIVEMELAGSRAYMLSYNTNKPGKEPKFRNLSQKEYLKIQAQMRNFLKNSGSAKSESEHCDREIVYTKVEEESKVSNQSVCWARLGSKKRTAISDWLIEVRKSLQ